MSDTPVDREPVDDDAPGGDDAVYHEGVLDRLRDSPVGFNDPNIVGDAGPFDVPPGRDADLRPDEVGPAGLPLLPADEDGGADVQP